MAPWAPAAQAATKAGTAGASAATQAGVNVAATAATQGPAAAAASAGPMLAKLAVAAGPAGIAVAAVAAAATAAVVGIKMFGNTIEEQAKKLGQFSGAVARSQAESEIRMLFSTLRRTERIGPDVAKWESLRGQFDEKFADIGTELLSILLKFANEFEESAKVGLKTLELIAKGLEKATPYIVGALKHGTTIGIIAQILQKIYGNQEEEKEDKRKDFGWDEFEQIGPTRMAWTPPAANAPRRGPQFGNANIPGLGNGPAVVGAGGL